MAEQPLVFVHVPKTAGTSLRDGLAEVLPPDSVVCDYGSDSAITHPALRDQPGPDERREVMERLRPAVISGHFTLVRYASLVPPTRMFTMLRAPEAHAVSQFLHRSRMGSFDGSFEEFLELEDYANTQARLFGDFPVELLGFIGLAERFDESCALFEHRYGISPRRLRRNEAKQKPGARPQMNAGLRGLIARTRKQDTLLYKRATWLFDARLKALANGQPHVVGRMKVHSGTQVEGLALNHDSPEPAQVRLVVGKRFRSPLFPASEPVERWKAFALPRDGNIGFSYTLPLIPEPGEVVRLEYSDGRHIGRHVSSGPAPASAA
ncbi:hypothetical protein FDP22_03690 [Paroceanicella profunda]|uniref:Sulfotransferase family protein n=1 Tax=Paroceanicella profunda TaxID=2579971 RepID=A0A5B8FWT8_9RHOB|nr:hypothetical protein [Paroceanicella profunda]QDL90969.1 hypothetical protein FDP22_03690 [Paroceanicella profunda]